MKQFLLPAGMKDIILDEVKVRKQIQEQLEGVFSRWGYENVVTPTIEYYETYQKGFGTIEEEKMYKFFDRSGKIVVLKADMTIPIARLAATKFREVSGPLRFYYCDKVYKVHEALSGMYNEMSDCGVELIGANESYDLEVLALANETMKQLDIQTWVMEIGNANIFNEACNATTLNDIQKQKLSVLIDEKQLPALQNYILSLPLDKKQQAFFLQLPWLSGNKDILEEAITYAYSEGLIEEIRKMQKLCSQLQTLGYENYTLDLGKMSRLHYYTGIIFEVYMEGVGSRILSGGRYDTLLEKFGKDMPAVGFSIKLDALLSCVPYTEKEETTLLYYPSNKVIEAMLLRKQYNGKVICIIDDTLTEIIVKEEV